MVIYNGPGTNFLIIFTIYIDFSSAEYCTIYCESGCKERGCEDNNVSIVLGSVAGGIGAFLLGVAIFIICQGYQRKKAKKAKIQHSQTENEKHALGNGERRTIKMDDTCTLVIVRGSRTMIVVDVKDREISIQRDNDIRTDTLVITEDITTAHGPARPPSGLF